MKKLLAGDGCDCYINVPGAARIDPHIVKRKRGVDPGKHPGRIRVSSISEMGRYFLNFKFIITLNLMRASRSSYSAAQWTSTHPLQLATGLDFLGTINLMIQSGFIYYHFFLYVFRSRSNPRDT